jgi:MFS family permease
MADPGPGAQTTGFVAFRHRDFRFVFANRILSAMATAMIQVAIGWEIYVITSDPFILGLVGLCLFLPNLIFFLPAGIVADRFPRRLVIISSYSVQVLAAALLFLVFSDETPSVTLVLGIIFIIGTGRTFSAPASTALVPNVVPPEHFPNAVAWSNATWELAVILGPMIGGLLLTTGAPTVCAIVCGIYCCCITLISSLRTRVQVMSKAPVRPATILAGLRYIFDRRIILGAVSLDLFAVLLGGATALLPVYAKDILQIGPEGLGLLRSSIAVGAVACGLVIIRVPVRRHAGRILLVTVAIFGAAITVFGFSEIVWLSMVALAVAGAADMVSVYIRQTLIQLATPDEMRGRVSAVTNMFVGASNELGEFRAGSLAAAMGVVVSVVAGGVGTVLVALSWAFLFPRLRRIDALDVDSLRDEDASATIDKPAR